MAEAKTGPKLGFFGPMKTLDSAQYGFEELPRGRLRAWIRHDPMRGVTPIIGPILNRIIRKVAFSTEMFRDWILHDIEESGETEKFVPALFAHTHAEE